MNEQEEYLMIDHTIEIDISSLPKLLQNTIIEMEEYEKKGEWIMYDGLAEGLESFAKSALLENKISNAQYDLILKKYGISVDPFYSSNNIRHLENIVRDIKEGKDHFVEHDLIEDFNKKRED
jgi:hypothetical protein